MIIVITGPTGVGKTKLSILLAKKYDAVIVNADSMQVYRQLNIGTAKIKEEEKEGVKHLLFDIKEPSEMYSVYDYQRDLRKVLEEHKRQNIIIVGGTGLYIKAGLYDYRFEEEEKTNSYDDLTNEELYQLVKEKDDKSDIHVNNRKRLVRVLNRKESTHNKDKLLYPAIFIGLTTDRDNLYDLINKRVDKMFDEGLMEEVLSLYRRNIRSKAVLTGIGYKELYDYFDGKISLDEAKNLVKKRSRHYAKRQYTWFNNQMSIKWFKTNYEDFDRTAKEVFEYIETLQVK